MESRNRIHFLIAILIVGLLRAESSAKLLLLQKDALQLAFPEKTAIEKITAFLNPDQLKAAEKLAQAKIESAVWTCYVGKTIGGISGYAYFDRIIIRTMPATVMVALDAQGKVRFVEILSFDEPEDYLPRKRWLEQFSGRKLDEDLRLKGGIRNMAGATLSSHAFTQSVRRVLAIHQILHP